ncbi:MAG TPA: isochorismatase family cysteine hydrolase [Thermomonas sp.]|nr:isochorismatase family cysteine hydrolase [Thermomonas sp.]
MPARAAREGWQRPALLLVDLFNRFDFEGGAALARHTLRILPALRRLRDGFDARGLRVIHANDNFLDWNSGFPELVAACRAAAGPASSIAEALAPAPHHCHLLKPRHSAFLATPLPLMLHDLEADGLVIAGIAADSCVLASAQDAKMRDVHFAVPHDATAAISPARKAAALQVLRHGLQADIRGVRSLLASLP